MSKKISAKEYIEKKYQNNKNDKIDKNLILNEIKILVLENEINDISNFINDLFKLNNNISIQELYTKFNYKNNNNIYNKNNNTNELKYNNNNDISDKEKNLNEIGKKDNSNPKSTNKINLKNIDLLSENLPSDKNRKILINNNNFEKINKFSDESKINNSQNKKNKIKFSDIKINSIIFPKNDFYFSKDINNKQNDNNLINKIKNDIFINKNSDNSLVYPINKKRNLKLFDNNNNENYDNKKENNNKNDFFNEIYSSIQNNKIHDLLSNKINNLNNCNNNFNNFNFPNTFSYSPIKKNPQQNLLNYYILNKTANSLNTNYDIKNNIIKNNNKIKNISKTNKFMSQINNILKKESKNNNKNINDKYEKDKIINLNIDNNIIQNKRDNKNNIEINNKDVEKLVQEVKDSSSKLNNVINKMNNI